MIEILNWFASAPRFISLLVLIVVTALAIGHIIASFRGTNTYDGEF
jgi:hypothetical protein